ncbi:hypothetical protein [Streptomyces mirabilis]|uniref:hypothetical protein n=1 Tax=Streptomyces mirabilis TaxID=68239 RepID=UPI0036D7F70B
MQLRPRPPDPNRSEYREPHQIRRHLVPPLVFHPRRSPYVTPLGRPSEGRPAYGSALEASGISTLAPSVLSIAYVVQ